MASDTVPLRVLLQVVFGIVVIEALAMGVMIHVRPPKMAVIGGARVMEILMILWISASNSRLRSMGLSPDAWAQGVRQGLFWSGIFAMTALGVYGILHTMGVNPLPWLCMKLSADPLRRTWFLIVAAGIAPLAEEMCFRAVVYGFFRRWGIAVALTTSTMLFVLAHANTGTIPIPQTIGGVVFGLAYEKTGTIMTPFVIHASGNLALFGISAWMGG